MVASKYFFLMIGGKLMQHPVIFSKIYLSKVYIFDGVEICFGKLEKLRCF